MIRIDVSTQENVYTVYATTELKKILVCIMIDGCGIIPRSPQPSLSSSFDTDNAVIGHHKIESNIFLCLVFLYLATREVLVGVR
ncbi:MAG TPA: hypothetical protein VE544_05975 [Nitrososphaeraceae archaeon]|jgi:hypothetical protein|nr:hypothetical protein [Nitrososphaeraceae archaeon]